MIREEFIDILRESGTTGKAIAHTITSNLERFALELDYLRGQGYDGASNMAGKYNGTAALIQDTILIRPLFGAY